ncbi:MAG TPA: Hsp70 family protein, partial [Candidatus Paceibacterota bacterium]
FKKESGIDVTKDPLALQRLKEAAEKTKHELSETREAEINIPFITSDASGPRHLLLKMTRAKLEELAQEFIDRSIEITRRALAASGYQISDIDEMILVGGQTRMPAIFEAVKKFFSKEPNRSINPDEVVAIGAAIQAGIFQGDVKDVLLLDVIPLSLGIETMGGVNTKIIERNTTIPASKSQIFSTAADNQTSVEIHVIQGERAMVADNKSLGRFILDGLPPAPRGLPQVEVTFDIDANGILSVKAKDKNSGREQSIRIEARSSLTPEDIDRMKKEAEAHSAEDQKKKEEAETRNNADQLIYTAEKSLREAAGKIDDDLKKDIEAKIAALKKNRDTGASLDELKRASTELSVALSKIGEALQKASSQPGTGAGDPTDNPPPKNNNNGPIRDAETS